MTDWGAEILLRITPPGNAGGKGARKTPTPAFPEAAAQVQITGSVLSSAAIRDLYPSLHFPKIATAKDPGSAMRVAHLRPGTRVEWAARIPPPHPHSRKPRRADGEVRIKSRKRGYPGPFPVDAFSTSHRERSRISRVPRSLHSSVRDAGGEMKMRATPPYKTQNASSHNELGFRWTSRHCIKLPQITVALHNDQR